ncbi:hypothetical protein DFJ73DRAFT_793403, partial [Zopfochytrium polystomum]
MAWTFAQATSPPHAQPQLQPAGSSSIANNTSASISTVVAGTVTGTVRLGGGGGGVGGIAVAPGRSQSDVTPGAAAAAPINQHHTLTPSGAPGDSGLSGAPEQPPQPAVAEVAAAAAAVAAAAAFSAGLSPPLAKQEDNVAAAVVIPAKAVMARRHTAANAAISSNNGSVMAATTPGGYGRSHVPHSSNSAAATHRGAIAIMNGLGRSLSYSYSQSTTVSFLNNPLWIDSSNNNTAQASPRSSTDSTEAARTSLDLPKRSTHRTSTSTVGTSATTASGASSAAPKSHRRAESGNATAKSAFGRTVKHSSSSRSISRRLQRQLELQDALANPPTARRMSSASMTSSTQTPRLSMDSSVSTGDNEKEDIPIADLEVALMTVLDHRHASPKLASLLGGNITNGNSSVRSSNSIRSSRSNISALSGLAGLDGAYGNIEDSGSDDASDADEIDHFSLLDGLAARALASIATIKTSSLAQTRASMGLAASRAEASSVSSTLTAIVPTTVEKHAQPGDRHSEVEHESMEANAHDLRTPTALSSHVEATLDKYLSELQTTMHELEIIESTLTVSPVCHTTLAPVGLERAISNPDLNGASPSAKPSSTPLVPTPPKEASARVRGPLQQHERFGSLLRSSGNPTPQQQATPLGAEDESRAPRLVSRPSVRGPRSSFLFSRPSTANTMVAQPPAQGAEEEYRAPSMKRAGSRSSFLFGRSGGAAPQPSALGAESEYRAPSMSRGSRNSFMFSRGSGAADDDNVRGRPPSRSSRSSFMMPRKNKGEDVGMTGADYGRSTSTTPDPGSRPSAAATAAASKRRSRSISSFSFSFFGKSNNAKAAAADAKASSKSLHRGSTLFGGSRGASTDRAVSATPNPDEERPRSRSRNRWSLVDAVTRARSVSPHGPTESALPAPTPPPNVPRSSSRSSILRSRSRSPHRPVSYVGPAPLPPNGASTLLPATTASSSSLPRPTSHGPAHGAAPPALHSLLTSPSTLHLASVRAGSTPSASPATAHPRSASALASAPAAAAVAAGGGGGRSNSGAAATPIARLAVLTPRALYLFHQHPDDADGVLANRSMDPSYYARVAVAAVHITPGETHYVESVPRRKGAFEVTGRTRLFVDDGGAPASASSSSLGFGRGRTRRSSAGEAAAAASATGVVGVEETRTWLIVVGDDAKRRVWTDMLSRLLVDAKSAPARRSSRSTLDLSSPGPA